MNARNLQKVFKAVVAAVGSNMSRFEAVECAEHLLRKAGGDVNAAVRLASAPYKIGGRFVY